MAVSRRVRAAWVVGGSVFTVVILSVGTLQAVAALAHEERTFHRTVDEPITAIDIAAAGSVTVRGADVDSVTIEERVSDGLRRPERSTSVENGVLRLRGTCAEFPATFCGVDFDLRVPREVGLRIRASGVTVIGTRGGADIASEGDDISLHDIAGEVRLSSQGGDIDATGLGGFELEAESQGGNIALSVIGAPRRIDARSFGGDIDIDLPDGPVAYRVETSTHGGSTDTQIRTDPTSPRVVRAESYGGDITIRYTEKPDTG